MNSYQNKLKVCQVYIDQGDYGQAMTCAHELLDIYENDHPQIDLANIFEGREKMLVNTPNAILYVSYLQRLIELLEAQGAFKDMVHVIYSLGIELVSTKSYTEAEIIFNRAMKISKDHDLYSDQADLLNGYGNINELQDLNLQALDYYLAAYNLSKKYDYLEGQRFAHNIGFTYKKIGKLTKAIHYLTKCINYLKTTDMTARLANSYNELGDSYRINGNYTMAHQALDKGLSLSKATQSNSFIMENHQFRSLLYQAQGNYQKALEEYKTYTQMNANFNAEKFQKEIATLRLKRELSSKSEENRVIKEKNQALEAYSKALQASNQALKEAMEEVKFQTEKAIQLEKEASYNRMMIGISHQLNTSTSNISLMAEQTLQELNQLSLKLNQGKLMKSDLNHCINQTLKSLDIINDSSNKIIQFIDLIRSDSIAISDLKNIGSIEEVLLACERQFHAQLTSKNCSLTTFASDDLPKLYAINLVKLIINQLMDNALKYAFNDQASGQIKIKIWVNKQGRVNIQFDDNGSGIKAKDLGHIFDPFYTSNMGKTGGTGMGLYIVKKTLDDVLNGSILCQSSPGHGTSMLIEIDPVTPVR